MPTDKPTPRTLPPHLQRALAGRSHSIDDPQAEGESRRKALERRRIALQFDIDQGELAEEFENPWTHRIALLTEALANVESDLHGSREIVHQPYAALPETKIEDIQVTESEPYGISFSIQNIQFQWQEKLDWIERGGMLAQPVLEQTSGDVIQLTQMDLPAEVRDVLNLRLADSVTSYATALRDAHLNGEQAPHVATLRDLLPECPVCGGWMDFRGHCNTCAARKVHEHNLFLERQHLMKERSAEAEERHRLTERLPLARKRMADLEREIAELDA